jgi:hypothetical protein
MRPTVHHRHMNHRGCSPSAASVMLCRPAGTGTVESVGLSSSRTVTPGGNAASLISTAVSVATAIVDRGSAARPAPARRRP